VEEFGANLKFTSELDRVLPLGISNKEWQSLWFDVLGVNAEDYRDWAQQSAFTEIEGFMIAGYPMLSRINNNFMDVTFEGQEIERLRQECVQVKSITNNKDALSGMDKLMRICDEAQKIGLNIYFMCD